jgi:hypothetical protein
MIVIDEEPAPLFRQTFLYSYWHARCEYAGYHNEGAQWRLRRTIESAYHAECYCIVLTNECKQKHISYAEEDIMNAVYIPGFRCSNIRRFNDHERARHWISWSGYIPPWCQYCMQMF